MPQKSPHENKLEKNVLWWSLLLGGGVRTQRGQNHDVELRWVQNKLGEKDTAWLVTLTIVPIIRIFGLATALVFLGEHTSACASRPSRRRSCRRMLPTKGAPPPHHWHRRQEQEVYSKRDQN